ncbi:MAG: fibronectin type III domain-containing protein [Candidatus Marinimicrobia bacterium]|nr:fibronectin type III domain-containing protein [Candidatus Neomarinimicrobiota bacterium]
MKITILRIGFLGFLLFFAIINCEKIIYTSDNTDPTFAIQPSVIVTADTSVTLYWETSEACHAEVQYGTTTEYDSVYTETENRQLHTIIIDELLPHMTYHYLVRIWDFTGNGPVESDDVSFTTLPNEYSFLREAWEKYTEQQFTEAISLIGESLEINDYDPEIIATSGWIYLQVNQTDNAREAIETAYQLNPYMSLVLVGKTLLAQMDGLPNDVINYCHIIVSREPEWEYHYNPAINISLVHLLMAEAYVQINQVTNAKNQLDLAWSDNGLDPNIADSWVVNGETYNDFILALLAAIHYAMSQL